MIPSFPWLDMGVEHLIRKMLTYALSKGSVFSYILFEHSEKEEEGKKKNDAFSSLILFFTTT